MAWRFLPYELYTIQRYLQYRTLQEHDLQHFDAWASMFGETVTAVELTPEGTGYRAKTRFAKFNNLPELMAMFKQVADIKTADMLNLPVPEVEYHNIAVPELTELYRQNNDLVGWICVEDTNINYPVMQTVDNPNYYLKRGFDKEYSSYGCPYVQEDCDVLKPSDNLVIYGHHMNNGSMFADLEKFKDEDFWQEHKTIAFNTLTEKNEYEILAVFKTVVYTDSPEAFKYYRFTDAQSPEEFDAYIEKCKGLSLYDTGVSAEYGDKLITLSTCEYSRTNGRLVVVAKKVTESSGANAPANDGAAEIPS